MHSTPSKESKRATSIAVMIYCVALIPFIITRPHFPSQFPQTTYLLLAASFTPWLIWWNQASKLMFNARTEGKSTTITALLFMLLICVAGNSLLLWIVFISCVNWGVFPVQECGVWIYLAVLAQFTVGLLLMLVVTRRSSKSNTLHIRELLLLWLGLILPLLAVQLGNLVIYQHGTLPLYEWFFGQALGFATAFYGLTTLDAKVCHDPLSQFSVQQRIMDEKTFEQRLKETVAWCTRNSNLSKSAEYLRTPALRPSIDGGSSLFMVGSNQATIAIEAMDQKRKKLLTDEALMADSDRGLAGGRLLVYFLGASNHNGVTTSISDYFDDEDNPPWDTWICCIAGKELTRPDEEQFDVRVIISQRANTTDYVISWVPPEWIEKVADAMRCEVTGAIMWADTLVSRPEKYAIFDFHRCYIPGWLERYTIQ